MTANTKKFLIALGVTIIWFFIMRPFTPPNIVAFELAGTTEIATQIINTWWKGGNLWIRVDIGIYLDFVFILAYCSAFTFACRAASAYSGIDFFIKTSQKSVWIISLAGLCDAIENIAMLKTLDTISQTTVSIAFYAAAIKFSILLIALIFIQICIVAGVFRKLKT